MYEYFFLCMPFLPRGVHWESWWLNAREPHLVEVKVNALPGGLGQPSAPLIACWCGGQGMALPGSLPSTASCCFCLDMLCPVLFLFASGQREFCKS